MSLTKKKKSPIIPSGYHAFNIYRVFEVPHRLPRGDPHVHPLADAEDEAAPENQSETGGQAEKAAKEPDPLKRFPDDFR